MRTIKTINADAQMLGELKGLVEVYEELAASQMQHIRADILTSREFFEGLAKLSEEVGADFSRVPQQANQRSVAVFISANGGMFGEIVEKVFMDFLRYIREVPSDVVIVGKWGTEMMRNYAPNIQYSYREISDNTFDLEELTAIMGDLGTYGKIMVFYGKFQSLATQQSTRQTISGNLLVPADQRKLAGKHLKFIYEPSIDAISAVFSSEIFASVFEQTVRESQLAKYASRLMHLDGALTRIDEHYISIDKEKRKAKKRKNEKRQLAMTAGIKARGI